ncbi:hypothetical protein ACE6H2_009648 [Prunus campanulata]
MRPTLSSTTELKIINDRETERSRNFGFVTFNNEKAMKDAIEGINSQNLDGRNITINMAQSRVAYNNGFLEIEFFIIGRVDLHDIYIVCGDHRGVDFCYDRLLQRPSPPNQTLFCIRRYVYPLQ